MSSTALMLIFSTATQIMELPTGLLESVCYVESTHNIRALHINDGGTDSYGVCQVKYETARWLGYRGSANQLMDPSINIFYAAKLLKKQILRYNGNIEKAVIAYNRGNARNLTQTRYSKKVLTEWRGRYYAKSDF